MKRINYHDPIQAADDFVKVLSTSRKYKNASAFFSVLRNSIGADKSDNPEYRAAFLERVLGYPDLKVSLDVLTSGQNGQEFFTDEDILESITASVLQDNPPLRKLIIGRDSKNKSLREKLLKEKLMPKITGVIQSVNESFKQPDNSKDACLDDVLKDHQIPENFNPTLKDLLLPGFIQEGIDNGFLIREGSYSPEQLFRAYVNSAHSQIIKNQIKLGDISEESSLYNQVKKATGKTLGEFKKAIYDLKIIPELRSDLEKGKNYDFIIGKLQDYGIQDEKKQKYILVNLEENQFKFDEQYLTELKSGYLQTEKSLEEFFEEKGLHGGKAFTGQLKSALLQSVTSGHIREFAKRGMELNQENLIKFYGRQIFKLRQDFSDPTSENPDQDIKEAYQSSNIRHLIQKKVVFNPHFNHGNMIQELKDEIGKEFNDVLSLGGYFNPGSKKLLGEYNK